MSTRNRTAPLILALALLTSASSGEDVSVDLGAPVRESELAPWSITVFPNGQGLPAGHGSVSEGEALYQNQCIQCHGPTGSEGPAARLAGPDGFVRPEHGALLSMSVGSRWPYATSIFDYVRRAMPHSAPKSLTNDQVYALTAYILQLNDLVADDFILTRENLPGIAMPARADDAPSRAPEH
jgi:mono/diheme cytochrome c family protein